MEEASAGSGANDGATTVGVKSAGRGIYRKRGQRAAAEAQPCAWKIGDRKSFNVAKARTNRGILGDPNLSGHEKAALAAGIDHMNEKERWSCFISIDTMSKESGASRRVCWRAIGKADGKHILTRRGKRPTRSKYAVVYITIHPNYMHTHALNSPNKAQNKVPELASSLRKLGARTGTNKVPELAPEPSLREPSVDKKGKKEDLDSEKRNGKEKRLGEEERGKEPSHSPTPNPSFNPFDTVPAPAFPRHRVLSNADDAAELGASLERLESARRGRLQ